MRGQPRPRHAAPPATPCDGACNPMWWSLQPHVTEAATLCVPGRPPRDGEPSAAAGPAAGQARRGAAACRLAPYCLLLATQCSLLAPYCSLLTPYYLLLTTCCSLLTTHYLLGGAAAPHCSPLTTHHLLLPTTHTRWRCSWSSSSRPRREIVPRWRSSSPAPSVASSRSCRRHPSP